MFVPRKHRIIARETSTYAVCNMGYMQDVNSASMQQQTFVGLPKKMPQAQAITIAVTQLFIHHVELLLK